MAVTLSTPIGIARELGNTDANQLTNAKAIDYSNEVLLRFRRKLIERGIDAAPIQEANKDMVDGVGTYLYPSDMFLPKELEVNFTSTPSDDNLFVPTDRLEEANLPQGVTMGWLRKNQPTRKPLVDYQGDFFEILPTPSASFWGGTSGSRNPLAIRLFYYLQPVLFTAVTDNLSYPETLDYFMFARMLKNVYLNTIGKLSDADLESLFNIEADQMVRLIRGGGQSQIKAKNVSLTGHEF